ncbi:MAG: S26 family signal peptidase [Alkalispirochaeta sp.]
MADRSRRHRARHAIRVLVLTIAVFGMWRFLGPGVAVVRDDSLSPILETGDIVWIKPAREAVETGLVVLVPPNVSGTSNSNAADSGDAPTPQPSGSRPDALVPRIIAGTAGDRVTWTDTSVSIEQSDGGRFSLAPAGLHPMVGYAERSVTVDEDSVFTVSLSGGMIDSRGVGPRPVRAVRYHVRRIIWPRERRGPISLVESGAPPTP